jgi:hypothetical protein
MGSFRQFKVGGELALLLNGFNIPVEISIASIRKQPDKPATQSFSVMAHFDTGASGTSIDIGLAQHIGLGVEGTTTILTAAGPQKMPTFMADLAFPSTTLSPFINLKMSSCVLGFKLDGADTATPSNFGLLLGRDVMSRWNIVWNGPSSTVLVND